jgi:hypothetical protein
MPLDSTSLNESKLQIAVAQGDIVLLAFRGKFKEKTTSYILDWIERDLNSNTSITRPLSKKIFKVAVELIQNLIHHSFSADSLFVFSKSGINNEFTISTSNLVDSSRANKLVSALNAIKSISEDELRDLKKNVMGGDARSEHGGGGMGLLELAKISNGNIVSELLPSQHDKMMFCISVHLKPIKA